MNQQFYIEISPLGESQFTGVAQVAAAICEQALADAHPPRFIMGRSLIHTAIVEQLVLTRDGSLLGWLLSRSAGRLAPLRQDFGRSVGIFPNRKYAQRSFDVEIQFVHDLSTVVTPQYHIQGTIDFHRASFWSDVPTNDLTVCDSDATTADVLSYLPNVDPDRVRTIPLSYHFDTASHHLIQKLHGESSAIEPFVMVLGTLEPRKNVRAVLELLARSPGLLQAARFLFVGRFGWGGSMRAAITELGLDEAVRSGRIVMTGFLSEPAKNLLLHQASLVLYPSLFEGFGLPVLEALAAGIPVVTTRSSSIPEAGGDAAIYFDPFIAGDLDRAVYQGLFGSAANQGRIERGRHWAAQFEWTETWKLLKRWAAQSDKSGIAA